MCGKKLIFIVLFFSFLFMSQALYGAQYENYRWGMTKEDAINLVSKNGYNIASKSNIKDDDSENIGYFDNLFGNEIQVVLGFTPKSKKLHTVFITLKNNLSSSDSFYQDLLEVLKERYGDPAEPSGISFKDRHIWNDGDTSIILEHQFKTKLWYRHNNYFKIYEKEMKEINTKEAEDKL